MKPYSLNIYQRIIPDPEIKKRLDNFLEEYRDTDPTALRLKLYDKNCDSDEREFTEFALLQLEARKKFSGKFHSYQNLLFPSMLAGEQASNDKVSAYHASLISDAGSVLDLTAGLGIDFMSMSKNIGARGEHCTAIEIDPEKADCLIFNLKENGLEKAEVIRGDSMECLRKFKDQDRRFDMIFVDPARRDSDGKRLYDPAACQPDIVGNIDLLFEVTERIVLKNSPMMDVSRALEIFPDCEILHLVSVRNECKELLMELKKGSSLKKIVTADILSDGHCQTVEVMPEDLNRSYEGDYIDLPELSEWLDEGEVWLYEPSVTQMKLGAWNTLLRDYPSLRKSSPNSHIFISKEYHENFPGRILVISRILDRKGMKEIKGEPRNVVTRNYPLKAVPLMKKLRVNSCNDKFIYGLTISINEIPLLIDCTLY